MIIWPLFDFIDDDMTFIDDDMTFTDDDMTFINDGRLTVGSQADNA